MECYDCSSGVWHDLTPMIIPRKFVGSAILDDQLYAVGGINDQYGDLVTVEACNLSTNQWTSLASLQECKGNLHVTSLTTRRACMFKAIFYFVSFCPCGQLLKSRV